LTDGIDSASLQVDSARYYANEAECVEAIRKSGIDRSKVFYTTKVPVTHMSYEKAKEAIEASLAAAAGISYIDL
jgi:diketogulonate reductase-like aldo/keto reductase